MLHPQRESYWGNVNPIGFRACYDEGKRCAETAHVAALSYLIEGGTTTTLKLGTRKGHSVRAMISSVERVSGMTVSVKECPRRAGGPPVLVANAEKAEILLGWRPRNPGLGIIVDSAFRWHSRSD